MSQTTPYTPVVSIIGFHHARGPEVEHWIGVDNENEISEWPLLPFLALADGAHFAEEDFSYFTLRHEAALGPKTLFGISCTRQLDSNELIDRPAEVTRSTVQKAVVVIASNPTFFFGHLKQQLSAVTTAWFAQRNFEDLDIIRRFQESLKALRDDEYDRDQYIGLSLRELVYEFRHQTLVLFKCALLQPKMLFFGSRCERLCMTQFSLLSLVPGLLRNLEDCSDPELNTYETKLKKPTSVRTSDRRSLLKFMGLPLQIFGKGSLFGPYTPLQQLDILADFGTKSYIVGSTNSLLLQQRDRYSDILVNLDENTIEITSSSLRAASILSAADRRWIDALVLSVTESWDEADPSRPKTMGFVGSEDYIRLQFEEYVLSMVSAVKYHLFLEKHHGSDLNLFLPDIEGDPAYDFQMDWVDNWKMTENFRIFQKFTDSELFDLVPPKHVMAGGLTMEDVQRRIVQQMKELGVDEKVNRGREVLATTLASGRNNVSTVFNNLSKNVEKFREQRRSQDLANLQAQSQAQGETKNEEQNTETASSPGVENPPTAVPVAAVVTPVLAEASTRAGAYFSSWASWAGEKRKKVFTQTPIASPPPELATNEKSLPALPDDPPPKKSFEESIFDARMRAAHGRSSSSSSAFSPQRSNSMTNSIHPVNETKDLSARKGVGLGIVNIEPQSPPPAEVVKAPKLEKVEPTLPPLPIEVETDIPPPTPIKDELTQSPSPRVQKKVTTPAPLEVESGQSSIPAIGKPVQETPESEIVSAAQPSLSFVRRRMTTAEKAEISQPSMPLDESVQVPPKSEQEEVTSTPPSLSFMKRKMTLPKAGEVASVPVEEKALNSPEPEQERVTSPPPPLLFMKRKTTLPRSEAISPESGAGELSVPVVEGKAVEIPKPEHENAASPPPLAFMRRKMTLRGPEVVSPKSESVEDKAVEPPEPEHENAASPPPLPFMRRKMTLRGTEVAPPKPEGVVPTQSAEPVVERLVESPRSEAERAISPPLLPATEKTEKPLRPGRLVQSRSFGPAAGEIETPSIPDKVERNRRSIPIFDKSAMKPPRSERTPEPVKIPEYAKAPPAEVKSIREKAESARIPRHSRAESAVVSAGESAPKPLRRAETQSATMIGSKTSGESLRAAKHTRSESSSSITATEKLAPKSERVKGSIAERAKRFSQTQDEPSDSGNVSPARAAFAARRAMFEKK